MAENQVNHKKADINMYKKFSSINFSQVKELALKFAEKIESNRELLVDTLLEYESFEVANDEIERTLDLLKSLEENKEYFSHRVGAVTAFMPRNQPVYALTCFVLVPSLMAEKVYFRIPAAMKFFFPKIIDLLEVVNFFPNIVISEKERLQFLAERTALKVNPDNSEETLPVTDAVIFTGTSKHADQLRMVFDNRTLFITNGSGHNPIVIAKSADLETAAEAVLSLTLYNQGQDCAAPNTILIEDTVYDDLIKVLLEKLQDVKIGAYKDRECRVGPISSAKDLVRVKEFLVNNREYIHERTPGLINTLKVILEPVVITKPLEDGGNYEEIFAPVIMAQKYSSNDQLKEYFENKKYLLHAMYVTLYGENDYILNLKDTVVDGRKIHDKYSVLHNTHLHAPGVERGTQPYGGRGYGASSTSFKGKLVGKATLPQRDMYEMLIKPIVTNETFLKEQKELLERTNLVLEKDVKKLLKIKNNEIKNKDSVVSSKENETFYVDSTRVDSGEGRFVQIGTSVVYSLLERHNSEFISELSLSKIEQVIELVKLLKSKKSVTEDEFKKRMYAIPKKDSLSDDKNKIRQKDFFLTVYKLLFGKEKGPRLNHFLYEIDNAEILPLLDI